MNFLGLTPFHLELPRISLLIFRLWPSLPLKITSVFSLCGLILPVCPNKAVKQGLSIVARFVYSDFGFICDHAQKWLISVSVKFLNQKLLAGTKSPSIIQTAQ